MKSEKSMKKKKVSFSKRQLNKHKRIQAKIKAKASERKRKKMVKGNVNVPRKYKYKFLSKRVNHNGGQCTFIKIPKFENNFIYIYSSKDFFCGEFNIKAMIRVATRLNKRKRSIKKVIRKKLNKRFFYKKIFYKRFIRAYVSFSERALGLRLGRGKGKLGGWRIPIRLNQVLYRVNFILGHGKTNLLRKTNSKLSKQALKISGNFTNLSDYYVYG